MSSAPTGTRSMERLEQVLQLLSDVSTDNMGDKRLQHLGEKASKLVMEMRRHLQNRLLDQLTALVRTKQWDSATEVLKNNLQEADRAATVRQVVALVCSDDVHTRLAIKWAKKLDAQLQPPAFEALFLHTNDHELLVLRLLKNVRRMSVGVRDEVRRELECKSSTIMDACVQRIKDHVPCHDVPAFFVASVVRKVEAADLVLEWSRCCLTGRKYKLCFSIVAELTKTLEDNNQLDSAHARHLWLHVKGLQDDVLGSYQAALSPGLDVCDAVLDKLLDVMKVKVFPEYQLLLEHRDKRQLINVHLESAFWGSMVCEFVSWYYNGNSDRTGHLWVAAAMLEGSDIDEDILCQLHAEMVRMRHINTLDAFRLYNRLKSHYHEMLRFGHVEPPACVGLLLSASTELRLVNKCHKMPLGVQQHRVVLCNSEEEDAEQLCTAQVHPDTALTLFRFRSGLQLHVGAQQVVIVEKDQGTHWMIKAVDEYCVKIANNQGKFLTAGVRICQESGKPIRGVILMKENDTDEQIWGVEDQFGRRRLKLCGKRKRLH